MISLVLALTLSGTAATSCEVACTNQSSRCHAQCDGPRCIARCGDRQNSCVASCDLDRTRKKEAKARKKAAPCEVSPTGAARPCSERERAEMKKALNSQAARSLCKDASGNLTACPDDLQLAEAQYSKQQDKCRREGNRGRECSTAQ